MFPAAKTITQIFCFSNRFLFLFYLLIGIYLQNLPRLLPAEFPFLFPMIHTAYIKALSIQEAKH